MRRPLELGRPAAYTRTLLTRRLAAVAVAGTAAGTALAVAVATVWSDHAQPVVDVLGWPVTAVVAVVAGIAVVGHLTRGRTLQLWAGIAAERKVARALRRAGPAAIVHGARPGGRGGDLDHVVLGPYVAAVETKHGRGTVRVGRDGRVSAGGKRLPRDPVGQAGKAARRAGRTLGLPVTPVLCIAGMTGGPFQVDDVWVTGARTLPELLGRLPRMLTDDAAVLAGRRLHGSRSDDADVPARAA